MLDWETKEVYSSDVHAALMKEAAGEFCLVGVVRVGGDWGKGSDELLDGRKEVRL